MHAFLAARGAKLLAGALILTILLGGMGRGDQVAPPSTGASLSGQPPGQVLIFADGGASTAKLALQVLEIPFEEHDEYDDFARALEAGVWELAIVEAPGSRYDWAPLIAWVDRGRRLLSSLWEPSDAFFRAMGAQAVESLSTPLSVHAWEGTCDLFSAPNALPSPLAPRGDSSWIDNGDRMEALGGATACAGFTRSAEPGEAAAILGNGGRTLINGFLFDDFRGTDRDGDGSEDVVEFVANEIVRLLTHDDRPVDARPLGPPEWQLGRPRTGSVRGHSFARGTVAVETEEGAEERDAPREYVVRVPEEGATLLAVHLHSDQGRNLDLYGRAEDIVEAPPEVRQVRSDFASLSPGGEEILVIANPKPGASYWFAVENREADLQTFEITAWVLPEIRGGAAGADGRVGVPANLPPPLARYLRTDRGLLALQQYRLEVPPGARRLRVQLEGEGELNLHLRFGQPVAIGDEDGQVEADVSSLSPGGQEVIVLAGNLLREGTYYIAIEGMSPPQTFVLTVSFEDRSGTRAIVTHDRPPGRKRRAIHRVPDL